MGTLDLVIAVPLIPNEKLEGPTVIAEDHRAFRKSTDGDLSTYGNIGPSLRKVMGLTMISTSVQT